MWIFSTQRSLDLCHTAFLAISPRFRSAPAPTGKKNSAMSSTKLVSYDVKNHIPNVFYQFKWILFINILYYEIKMFGM